MTYVYREPGESCFVVRSKLDEERDRLAAQGKKQINGALSAAASNRPGTPAGNKNKLSLSAWKSRVAGEKAEVKHPSPEKEVPKEMESQEVKKVNGVKSEVKPEPEVKKEELPAQSLKRYDQADVSWVLCDMVFLCACWLSKSLEQSQCLQLALQSSRI
jgi:hypothetical protein